MSEIKQYDKQTLTCMVTASEAVEGGKTTYYRCTFEVMEGLFTGDSIPAMAFQKVDVDSSYPITFSISTKNDKVLIAKRPPSAKEQNEPAKKKPPTAREIRLAKEAKEKAEKAADDKRLGITDAPPSFNGPASNLIAPPTKEHIALGARYDYEENDVKLMQTNNIIPPKTPLDQIDFFFMTAKLHGANPLMKQIYLLPFKSGKQTKYAIVTSIDLARSKAHKTGEFAGKSSVLFDGLPMHEWLASNPTMEFEKKTVQKTGYGGKTYNVDETYLKEGSRFPMTASISVFRMVNGQKCEFQHEVSFMEYYPGPTGRGQMWRQRPLGMISKCVEMSALRAAFADELGKMYVEEEFEKSEVDVKDSEYVDLTNVSSEIDLCTTEEELHKHRTDNPQLQNDPDYLKLLEDKLEEIQSV